jgi:hypothetical protein
MRMMDEIAMLSALGVLHRRKRYGRLLYLNRDPSIGSDSNVPDKAGLPFDRPLYTLAACLSYCESGRGDIIVLQPSIYDVTEDDVSIAIADLTLVGMLDPTSGYGFNPDAASTATILSLAAAADNVLIKNLRFDTTTGLQSAIATVSGSHFLKVEDCFFNLVGTTGPTGFGIDMDAGKVAYPVIRNCTFHLGTLIVAAIWIECNDALPFGALVENCNIVSILNGAGTGAAGGIYVADGTGVIVKDCDIQGGDPATAYNIGDGIEIAAGVLNTMISGCTIGNCDAGVTDGGTDTSGATAGEGWIDTTHA